MTGLVRVKNKIHGGVASLPESALQHMESWEQVEGPPPAEPKPRRDLRRLAAAAAKSEPEPTPKAGKPSATSEKE
jgi:hypothetical protein